MVTALGTGCQPRRLCAHRGKRRQSRRVGVGVQQRVCVNTCVNPTRAWFARLACAACRAHACDWEMGFAAEEAAAGIETLQSTDQHIHAPGHAPGHVLQLYVGLHMRTWLRVHPNPPPHPHHPHPPTPKRCTRPSISHDDPPTETSLRSLATPAPTAPSPCTCTRSGSCCNKLSA